MNWKLAACAAVLSLCTACGSSSNTSSRISTPAPSASGTAIPTIALGTRPPGATPRSTPASAQAGIPPTPATAAQLTTLPDGLKYQDLVVGEGATAQTGQQVTVNYTGWLEN